MPSKKLELLLSKLPEEKQDAFFAELKEAKPEEYEALLDRYGIVLDEEEKKFLTTPSAQTLSDSDLEGIAGGGGYGCPSNGNCNENCINCPSYCSCD